MNRKRVLIAAACALMVSINAVPAGAGWFDGKESIKGKGSLEQEPREIGSVTHVELSTGGTLFIDLGDRPELIVEAQGNLLEYVETRQRRGSLEIRTRRDVNLRPTRPIEYHLTVESLDEIVVSSSGDIVVGDVKTDRFTVEVLSSSGDVEIGDIESARLEVYISSSGEVSIESWHGTTLDAELTSSGDLEIGDGTAEELDIDLSSSGDCYARRLACRTARVRTSSSGNAEIQVSEYLHGRTSSSGDIVFYGNPEVEGRSSGSGDIRRGGP